jgi:pimeloyl-ACP methyl ester carboxylesterase
LPDVAQAPDGPFRGYRADAAGREIEFLEAGVGDPLLILGGSVGSALALALLATKRRVIAPDLAASGLGGATAREQAAAAGAVADSLGLGPCDLLAAAAGAEAALWRAADAPDRVRSLILESPPGPGPELCAALPGIRAPALVLFGTRDHAGPPAAGVTCHQLLPGAFLTFVYDAGPDIRGDRPEAFAAVVSDFLTRQGRFLARDGAERAP